MNIPPFLEDFLMAYIEAALWSSCDDNGQPLDKNYDKGCLAPETLRKMALDCHKFFAENNIASMTTREQKRAGHDFWLTRNGHGAGFWDGDWAEPQATFLTTAAHSFGTDELYVGDNNQIYGTPCMTPANERSEHEAIA